MKYAVHLEMDKFYKIKYWGAGLLVVVLMSFATTFKTTIGIQLTGVSFPAGIYAPKDICSVYSPIERTAWLENKHLHIHTPQIKYWKKFKRLVEEHQHQFPGYRCRPFNQLRAKSVIPPYDDPYFLSAQQAYLFRLTLF